MLRTQSQQNASRANGAKSHGPATPEGKERSSQNPTKHGLFSDSVLLQPENRAAWNQLAQFLVARFNPADNVEMSIIHDMAVTQWRKERAQNMEAAILDMEYQIIDMTESEAAVPGDEVRRIALAWSNAVGKHKALDDPAKQSMPLGKYWMRLHKKLKELQADRKEAEAQAPPPPPEPAKPKPRNEPGTEGEKRNGANMYWQVTLLEHREGSPQPRWLPEKWTPARQTSHAQPDAPGSDTGSVSADAETPEAAALTISMIEAMLRLIARYPGLAEKVAHAIPKQPGQSHLDNFNTMMAAISDQARYHPGLGVAISETLKPFRDLDR